MQYNNNMEAFLKLIFEDTFGQLFLVFGVPLVFITMGVFLAIYYIDEKRRKEFAFSGIRQIDRMSGYEFEKYLKELFVKLGFKAKLVGLKGGDYGADLVVEIGKRKIAVQAKRYRNTVGNKAVQEVIAAKKMYGADEGMVVTNSQFSDAAWHQAKGNSVILWDRQRLVKAILLVKQSKDTTKLLKSKWLIP